SEILFVEDQPGYWPIVTYDAKWRPDSRDYRATPPTYPAKLSPRLAKRVGELAKQAFKLTGCRDYARGDFRLRSPARPFILEVNPNSDFNPEAGLSSALQAAGSSYAQFAVQLVNNALSRAARSGELGLRIPALQAAP